MKNFQHTVNGTPYSCHCGRDKRAALLRPQRLRPPRPPLRLRLGLLPRRRQPLPPLRPQRPPLPGAVSVTAPMPGTILDVKVAAGRRRKGRRRAVHSGGHEDGKRNRCPAGRHRGRRALQ